MASLDRFAPRDCWRIRYTVTIGANAKRRARYCRTRSAANALQTRLQAVEDGTRQRVASDHQIREWIEAGYLTGPEAVVAFPGWRDTGARSQEPAGTDYERIHDAYEAYALRTSKARDPFRKAHRNHMSVARAALAWMRETAPDLALLTRRQIEDHVIDLQASLAEWTVHHRLTHLRLLLDRAVELHMIEDNPARDVKVPAPRTNTVRRILSTDEARALLDASLRHTRWIHGGLPTVARLGLYAGLRDEEMRWCGWDWFDLNRGILTVKPTTCALTGERWTPKDHEVRRLDVKSALVEHVATERERQQGVGLLGPYVLPGRPKGKPLGVDSLPQAWRKMTAVEGLDPSITVYSCRHTYATSLLREGVDLKTVQRRLGHASIRTTEHYLHELDIEARPTDKLPY